MLYPDGSADTYEYDASGRLVREETRTGQVTAYAYDVAGRLVSYQEEDRTTGYGYDLLGRITSVTLPDGTETQFTYDAAGNLTSQTDALGHTTQLVYDEASRVIAMVDAGGGSTSYAYDALDRLAALTDALGSTTQYAYDKVGRLSGVTDALGNETTYGYDALDNLASVTNALGHTTHYTYDALGNLLSETDALGNVERYEYSPEGQLAKHIRPDGTDIEYFYNEQGQLTMQMAGGELVLLQDYNEQGLIVIAYGADGETVYQHDAGERLVEVTHPGGEVVRYEYDALGRKSAVVYPDGGKVLYAYDAMDRLTGVTGLDGEVTRYTYDALGRRIRTEGPELVTEYGYDEAGRLNSQVTQGKTDLSLTYAYDAVGRMVEEKRTEAEGIVTRSYGYDALGQLTSFVDTNGVSESYTYDAAGNMVGKVVEGVSGDTVDPITYAMTYNAADQLTVMRAGAQEILYSYNVNGDLVEKALGDLVDQYAYDAQGNLASFTGYDGYMQTYAYGLFGVRTEKQEKGNPERVTLEGLLGGKTLARIEEGGDVADTDEWVKTRYIQDVTQAYAQVLVEIGEESRTAYAYGLERISGTVLDVGSIEGTLKTTYGYVYDGRGSVAQVVGDGAVTSMEYTAFGELMGDGVAVSGYGYNGEQYNAATGMLHLRARQYEPAMNRFSQKDVLRGTVETPLSLNRYAFVVNDPVNYADPSGLVPSAAIAAAEAAKSAKATSKGYADTGGYENQTKPSTVSARNATTVDYPVNSSASYGYSGPTTTTTTPPSNSTYTFLPATQRYGTTNSSSPLTGLVKSSNEVKKKAAEAYLTQQAQNAVTEAQRNAYQAAAAEVKNLNPNKAADLVKINQIVQAACSGELGKKKAEDASQAGNVNDLNDKVASLNPILDIYMKNYQEKNAVSVDSSTSSAGENVLRDAQSLLDYFFGSAQDRAAHAFDSAEALGDYLTFGLVKNMLLAGQGRWNEVATNPSIRSVGDLLTGGIVENAIDAFTVDYEHPLNQWLSAVSLGVTVALLYIGGKAITPPSTSPKLGQAISPNYPTYGYDSSNWWVDDVIVQNNPVGNSKGTLKIIEGGTYSQSEIRAAEYMRDLGNDVTLRPPVGTRAGGQTSDLVVNGVNYDVYTPITSNPSNIIRAIAGKNSQASVIVLDLSQSPVTEADLGRILPRVRGIVEAGGGTCKITDIIVLP